VLDTVRPSAAEATGGVRAFRHADIPAVIELRRRCFKFEAPPPASRLERDLVALFFDNPWRDPELPALVYEGAQGRVIGFLGVVPRPMSLGGAPIRVAATRRLMVEPEHRGAAALRLLQAFLKGPQDLSLADSATDSSRTLWTRLGGTTAVLYSIDWFRPIAPARAALGYLSYMTHSRALDLVARSAGRAVDAALVHLPKSPFRRKPTRFTGEEISEAQLLACLAESSDAYTLCPAYTPSSLAYLLKMLEGRFGRLRKIAVRAGAAPIGWYVYGLNRQGIAQVVRLAAAPGRLPHVVQHLAADAFRHGGAALLGRLEPRLLGELGDPLCIMRQAPWCLVHSRSAAVLEAIARGDAVLSRMEGEWWMPA
jgi:hypothetical protein